MILRKDSTNHLLWEARHSLIHLVDSDRHRASVPTLHLHKVLDLEVCRVLRPLAKAAYLLGPFEVVRHP